ncbi:hypothetical protein MmiHf6_12140 [Methanimicrococcus hongohii]|uniref:Uncharacterized protein n=2 Tax=Methanimicrococcus hongohii TaxID=3028295 RepID=A0AA96V047_9EURY|nr:hypothetical protein MmiHf6_12140 [Methanimicrococcus sp. Hf6]
MKKQVSIFQLLIICSIFLFLCSAAIAEPSVPSNEINLNLNDGNVTIDLNSMKISAGSTSQNFLFSDTIIISQSSEKLTNQFILVNGTGTKNTPAVNIVIHRLNVDRSNNNNPITDAAPFSLQNEANVTLILKGENSLTAGIESVGKNGRAGLEVPEGCEIRILSEEDGSLTVYGGNGTMTGGAGAGIGSAGGTTDVDGKNSGMLIIDGGIIEAHGGIIQIDYSNTKVIRDSGAGAGIGGGAGGNRSSGGNANVLIKNGIVKTYGGDLINNNADSEMTSFGGGAGAGIGGGAGGMYSKGGDCDITIENGTVYAQGGNTCKNAYGGGAGIGGGAGGFSSEGSHNACGGDAVITIYDGKITALGGNIGINGSGGAGAGIGGGAGGGSMNNNGGNGIITIHAGTIHAKGGDSEKGSSGGCGVGIGGGAGGQEDSGGAGKIVIYGGEIEAIGGDSGSNSGGGSGTGIGGGASGSLSTYDKGGGEADIEIFAGKITASGGNSKDRSCSGTGAGIGSGSGGTSTESGSCFIRIYDGEITANGGRTGDGVSGSAYERNAGGSGAAIGSAGGGGGTRNSGGVSGLSEIVIEKGIIKASGGSTGSYSLGGAGAGIGSGGAGGSEYTKSASSTNIIIKTGDIKAIGGNLGENGLGGAGAGIGGGGGGDSRSTSVYPGEGYDIRTGSKGGDAEIWIYDGNITSIGGTAEKDSKGGAGTGIGGGAGSHIGDGGNGSVLIYSGKIIAVGGDVSEGGSGGKGSSIGGGAGGIGIMISSIDYKYGLNGMGGTSDVEILNEDTDIVAFGGIGGGYEAENPSIILPYGYNGTMEEFLNLTFDDLRDLGIDVKEKPESDVIIHSGIVTVFGSDKGNATFVNSDHELKPITLFAADSKTSSVGISDVSIVSDDYKTYTRSGTTERLAELKDIGWTEDEIQKYEKYVADGTATVWLPIQPDNKTVHISKTGYSNFNYWETLEENAFDGLGDFIQVSPSIENNTLSSGQNPHKTNADSAISNEENGDLDTSGFGNEKPDNIVILLFMVAIAIFCYRRFEE